ncbi:AGAP003123-PA-like protein [Anopheles sinensis]|uniref:AGAP003123-PA-like protein n=1 Tax=Anopheles sinensis TaxID=74873 RepID=A0A084W4Y8_ANOSI|nr:AGAP003123-PA-like protein [Anopheles sinensis]
MGVNAGDSRKDSITSSTSTSHLDLELLQRLFVKFEPDLVIDSYEEAQGSGRGDNYTAALFRLALKGHTQPEGSSKKLKWEKSVICKRLPDCKIKREAFKSEALFRNEVVFYNSIMPEYNEFQRRQVKEASKSRGTKHVNEEDEGDEQQSESIFDAVPQCYLAQDDLLVLEDLRVRSFTMPDRQAGLGPTQLEAVLVELAKFHAVSLAYKQQHPVEFQKLTNSLSEGIFSQANTDWYRKYYDVLTRNAIQMVRQTVPEKKEHLAKLEAFLGNCFANLVELVSRESELSVICHGDCWTNNVLFRYADDGSIGETCFVDFQLIRYGSLALDLAYLIYCCTDSSLRKESLQQWLQTYHRQLVRSLKLLLLGAFEDLFGSEKRLWELINEEFKICARFGLGTAMDMLPISTCSSEEAPDLYASGSETATTPPELNVPPNELCRRKMTELVLELVDGGML